MLFIFDLGGVLFQNNDLLPEIARMVGTSRDELRARLHESLVAICSGEVGPDEFWRVVNRTLGTQITEDLWETLYHPTVDPCVCSVVEDIRHASHRLVAGTNTLDAHYRYHQSRGEFGLFDHVYASHLMGCVKPDPEFYRHILRCENTGPASAVFIDDMEENVRAARALGLHGIHFTGCDALRRELSGRLPADYFGSGPSRSGHPVDSRTDVEKSSE